MVSRPRRRRAGILAVLLIVVVCGVWWVKSSMFSPAGPPRNMIMQIPRGSSAASIARRLDGAGLVRSAWGFVLLARLRGQSQSLKPGAYQLSPAMTPDQILGKIARGEVCARWVTFPEGFTVWQIAQRLEAEGLADAERFFTLARTSGSTFKTDFPHPGDNLEGYLFPDSYLVPVGAGEKMIIEEMLETFGDKAGPLLSQGTDRLGVRQVVTLASLIEREARVPKDRPLISAVLRNRLSRGMRLECDATVLYALGRHKDRVFYSDVKVDSPYNTYLYPGLPPGPIANPGLASVKAALYPSQADFLYYTARADGSHIFTRTLDDHIRATRRARQERSRTR